MNIDKNTCVCGNKEFININIYAGWSRVDIIDGTNIMKNDFYVKSCTKCGTVKFIKRGD